MNSMRILNIECVLMYLLSNLFLYKAINESTTQIEHKEKH